MGDVRDPRGHLLLRLFPQDVRERVGDRHGRRRRQRVEGISELHLFLDLCPHADPQRDPVRPSRSPEGIVHIPGDSDGGFVHNDVRGEFPRPAARRSPA